MLRIASDLSLPLDTVTQAVAVLAKRRSGKSYLARRLTEQLHHGGQQVAIVDPKGDWWGILSSRDGKGAGLPIVILGGERGHVPLEATGGDVVAKLVVEGRVSVLIDLSLLRKHEIATFMQAFLEAVYRLKAVERYRTPLMLVIDEADAVAPQKPQPNEARMLGAAEDIVRRGGQRGIGCTLITQRAAVLNKNVLTQVQILIALRTISPQDIAAMNAWIDVHGTPEQRKRLIASLPSLPVGDAWVWSPGWPTDAGIFQRIHTLPIDTFDSGATPKPGEKRVEPARLADVDLDAVRAQMAATIERAKADDPKELRKRIGELERALADKNGGSQAKLAGADKRIGELTVALDRLYQSESAHARHARSVVDIVLGQLRTVQHNLENLRAYFAHAAERDRPASEVIAADVVDDDVPSQAELRQAAAKVRDVPAARRPKLRSPAAGANGAIAPGARRMLDVLAAFHPGKMTRRQVARAADMKITGGTFRTYWSALRGHYFVEEADGGDYWRASDLGLKYLGAERTQLPRSFKGRVAFWSERLRPGELRLLQAVLAAGSDITRAALAERVGMELGGGTFRTYLGALRTNNLVDEQNGFLQPHAWLLTGDAHG